MDRLWPQTASEWHSISAKVPPHDTGPCTMKAPAIPALITTDVDAVITFKPPRRGNCRKEIQVFRKRLPETAIVWTRHGFAGKKSLPKAIAGCDFACVSSEWVRDYEHRGRLADRIPREPSWRQPLRSANALFAPIYNKSLSAAPVLVVSGESIRIRLCAAATYKSTSVRRTEIRIEPTMLTVFETKTHMAGYAEAAVASSSRNSALELHSVGGTTCAYYRVAPTG